MQKAVQLQYGLEYIFCKTYEYYSKEFCRTKRNAGLQAVTFLYHWNVTRRLEAKLWFYYVSKVKLMRKNYTS